MALNYRLILAILSIIVTIILFAHDMRRFHKYVQRGRYYYQKISDDKYMVIKEGYSISNCSHNGTIFRHRKIDWLIVRDKRHYLFLFCFWGSIILPLVTSLIGSVFEYKSKSDSNWFKKIFRILRATACKSSMTLPVTILFAFDYKEPCLRLKAMENNIFSNTFAFTIIAIEFPLLFIIFVNEIYDFYQFYKQKSNPTYDSVENFNNNQTIRRRILYVILYLIVLFLLYLSVTLYIQLFLVISLPQYLLTGSNILLSIASILLASSY